MSAAAAATFDEVLGFDPTIARYGWPVLDPDGWSKLTHAMSIRGIRVTTPGTFEFDVCRLILSATVGVQQEWEVIEIQWFAYHLRVQKRCAYRCLAHAEEHGLISRERVGHLCRWRVNADLFETAPEVELDHEETGPQLVETLPVKQVPRTRLVEDPEMIRAADGAVIPRYSNGRLLLAEEPNTDTVAECGVCHTIGIYRMVPHIELMGQGEEKAKDVRSSTFVPPEENGSTTEPKKGEKQTKEPFVDERHEGVHKLLCRYKLAFGEAPKGRIPNKRQSLEVAELLGDAPISYLAQLLKEKGFQYFKNDARHYGIFKGFAKDAQEIFTQEVGELCPGCKVQRLGPNEQCRECGPPITMAEGPGSLEGDWGPVKVELVKLLTPGEYGNWVRKTETDRVQGDVLYVQVPNKLEGDILQMLQKEKVATALRTAHGDRFNRIEYVVAKE